MTAFDGPKPTRLDRHPDGEGGAERWLLRPANVVRLTGGTDTAVDRASGVGADLADALVRG